MASRPSKKSPQNEFLRDLLSRDNLKWNWDETAAECVAKPNLVPPLVAFCTDPEVPIQQTAGAVLAKIVDLDASLLTAHLPRLVEILKIDVHDAVKRAIMRVFQTVDVPEAIEGEVFDYAMKFLVDPDEPIAARAYSITIARRFCQRYPALRHELIPAIREVMKHAPPAAILSRARKDLKLLEALKDDEG